MILLKTEIGQQVLKDRSVRLTPRQRSAFILFDGRRSVADVLAAGMGVCRRMWTNCWTWAFSAVRRRPHPTRGR